jgi:hypothetical protein
LSLTPAQKEKIKSIEKVNLYEIENAHPKLLKPVVIDLHGKSVRGWYAWKPVIIKQTLDKYESVLYLDAGNTVLKPLTNLYKYIEQNGYFFVAAVHNIRDWITRRTIDYFKLESPENNYILNPALTSISANIIGINKKYYDSLIMPMYNHVKKDFYLFEDDGTSTQGFGKHRHDQTLFSVYAHLLKLKIVNQGYSLLKIDDKKVVFHTHYYPHQLTASSVIYQSRWDLTYGGKKTENDEPHFAQFIRYRK